jgi:hypothetical protein
MRFFLFGYILSFLSMLCATIRDGTLVNKRYDTALVVVSRGWLAFWRSRLISRRDMVATKA